MRKLLLSVLVLTLTAPVAFAAPDGADGERPRKERREGADGRRGHHGPIGVLHRLGLDDDQKAEVKQILGAAKEDAQAYREANADAVKALMADLKKAKEAGDKDAAMAAHEELKKIREASPMHAAFQTIVQDVLNDGQRAKLAELREKRGERGPRKGPRGKDAPVEG